MKAPLNGFGSEINHQCLNDISPIDKTSPIEDFIVLLFTLLLVLTEKVFVILPLLVNLKDTLSDKL